MNSKLQQWRTRLPPWSGALAALLLLVIVTSVLNPTFLKGENLFNILRQWSFVGIIAIGMTFVIILGGIDLSVGALVALAGGMGILCMNTVIEAEHILATRVSGVSGEFVGQLEYGAVRVAFARLFEGMGVGGSEGWGVCIGFLVILLIGLAAGWVNGMLVTRGRMAPFIATLGGLAAYRSLALAMIDGGEYRSASTRLFKVLGTGGIPIPGTNVAPRAPEPVSLLLPWPVIGLALVAVIAWVLLNRTRFGRYVVAIGCNERAAVYSAINVRRVKLCTYVLSGFLTGLAALLLASRMNAVSSSGTGQLYELDAIAAVVIGGTRMSGGTGTVGGTIVGILILGVVGNMLNLVGVSPYLQGLVKGAIIIAAVLIQRPGEGEE